MNTPTLVYLNGDRTQAPRSVYDLAALGPYASTPSLDLVEHVVPLPGSRGHRPYVKFPSWTPSVAHLFEVATVDQLFTEARRRPQYQFHPRYSRFPLDVLRHAKWEYWASPVDRRGGRLRSLSGEMSMPFTFLLDLVSGRIYWFV